MRWDEDQRNATQSSQLKRINIQEFSEEARCRKIIKKASGMKKLCSWISPFPIQVLEVATAQSCH